MADRLPKRFPLLVFDWDGTLIDSAPTIVECLQEACRDLGFTVPDPERAAHIIGLGLHQALEYAIPGLPASEYPRVAQRYRHHFIARDPEIALFSGTEAMLAALHQAGHVLAIATGKSAKGLERALRQTGLGQFFAGTRCADQCASKPEPDMLLELMDELGTRRDDTLMIGDTIHDLQMAGNAHVAALAVSHGAHRKETLLALAPLACVATTLELSQWLRDYA
jgi:phosphoglycolate phosphatase